MNAVILAGGKGTRLYPLTKNIPKPMITIGGKPLLYHHVLMLKKAGVKKIWIASGYLSNVITEYFGDGSQFGVKIFHSIEREPLGTAGCLRNPNTEIEKDLRSSTFMVVCGDNFTNFDYQDLIDFHFEKKSFMTLGLYRSNKPWDKGVVVTDENGKVLKMREKPPKDECEANTVNSSTYVCEPEVLDYIMNGFCDFGFDVIPKIVEDKRKLISEKFENKKELWALDNGFFVEDIGTFPGLRKARRLYKKHEDYFTSL